MGEGAAVASGISFLLLHEKVVVGCLKYWTYIPHLKSDYVEREMQCYILASDCSSRWGKPTLNQCLQGLKGNVLGIVDPLLGFFSWEKR